MKNKGKVLTVLSFVLLLSVLIGIVYFWVTSTFDKYMANRDVIQFAMEKPEFVRALKQDYASKSAQLEKEYMEKQMSPQDELIQEVVDQVKGSK